MSQSWWDILTNWGPMLLLIGVWIFFLVRMRAGPLTRYQKECFDLTKRQVEALERIANHLDSKN